MKTKIELLIKEHMYMLDKSLLSSKKIDRYLKDERLKEMTAETENRERLFNIIEYIQNKIEKMLNLILQDELSKEYLQGIKNWQKDMTNKVDQIIQLDHQIVCQLENAKDQTSKEIATIYKQKQLFKGYNLGDVHK